MVSKWLKASEAGEGIARRTLRNGRKAILSILLSGAILSACSETPSSVQDAWSLSLGGVQYSGEDLCINDIAPFFVENPSISQIQVTYSSIPLAIFEIVPQLEANDYVVDDAVTPRFSVFAGQLGRGDYAVATAMNHADECRKFVAIVVQTDQPDAFELLPVGDWHAHAGMDAVNAVNQLEQDCVAAGTVWGDWMESDEGTGLAGAGTDFGMRVDPVDCRATISALAFGLRIRGPNGDVIVSNILGEIFVAP